MSPMKLRLNTSGSGSGVGDGVGAAVTPGAPDSDAGGSLTGAPVSMGAAGALRLPLKIIRNSVSAMAAAAKVALFISLACFHCQVCVDETVDVAVHDGVDVAVFKAGARVLGQRVGHEDIGAYGAAEVYLHLHALDVADLLQVFALLDLGQLGAQHVLAVLEVLEVAALHLAGHDDAGRQVGQAHGAGGLVDLLAAGTGGAEHVHLDVLVAQLDLARVGDLGHDLHGGEARLPAAGGVEGADAHQAVHAVLALEIAVGVLALNLDGGALDARLLAVLPVEQGVGVAVALRPAGVHAVEHLRPVLRLGAARAGVDGEYGVVRVVLAGEQRGKAHLLQRRLEGGEVALQLVEHAVVVLLYGHLAQHHHVVPLGAQPLIALHLLLELLEALLHLLGVVHVVPEAVLSALGLKGGYLRARVVQLQRLAQPVQRGLERVQLRFVLVKFDYHVISSLLELSTSDDGLVMTICIGN